MTQQRQAVEMLCVDMLVPKEHLLRYLDAAVDFTRIYKLAEDLYCADNVVPTRPGGAVQAGDAPATVRHRVAAPDAVGCGSERSIPVVSGVKHAAATAALCNGQLCVPVPVHRRCNRGSVPVDTGGDCPCRISVAGGYIRGRDAHQGEREPGKRHLP